ncbi:MAG: glycosyltransferase [Desulfobacteraceae bacterium]|nr:glycosyltransferase [Desulfobacteraceae bacterium]
MNMKKDLPKISVVTPSFNQGQFLEKCIKSVIKQDYPDFEYIIIDGGSTDNSLDVIAEYKQYLAYSVSESDNGQSSAINKGFKKAKGELVVWLNSDDYYLPGAFRKVAEAYGRNPEASFYFGNGLRVDSKGMKKSRFFESETVNFNRDALLYCLNYILQPATFINASYLKKIGFLDEGLDYGMDTDLWLRLSKEKMPAFVPETLAASREYGDTKTSTGSFQRIEELRQIAERHTGQPMTPGILLYFLDTLRGFIVREESPFPQRFNLEVDFFSRQVSHIMRDFDINCIGFPYGEKHQKEQINWSKSLKQIKDLSDLLSQPEVEAKDRVDIIGKLQNHLDYIGIELTSQLKLIENLKIQMEMIDADRMAQLKALEGLSIRQNAWLLAKRLKKIIGLGRK